MAVTVTNTKIAALNVAQALTANAATSTVAGGSEVFTFTPTKSGGKIALIMQSESTGVVPASYSIAAGAFWASGSALTGTIGSTTAAAGIKVLEVETAKVLKADGTIAITVSPGDTDTTMLKTTHAFKMYALELL